MIDKPTPTPLDASQLDGLFKVASDVDIAPTEAFLTRLAEDAIAIRNGAVIASSEQNAKARSVKKSRRNLWQEIGGWRALGGSIAVLALGVMIGFNPPIVAMTSLQDIGLMANDEVLLVGLEGDWFGFYEIEGAEG
jgi:hypothetical protein